jgi:heptosyltransferase I
MVSRIREQRPDIAITWIIGSVEHRLLNALEGVEFVIYNKREGAKARKALRKQLMGRSFDALCVMQVALRANWLSTVVKAKIRLGFDKKHSKEGHSLFINKRIPPLNQPHVLEGFQAFADALGVPASKNPSWTIPVSNDDENFAHTALSTFDKCVAICPAASKLERCWNAKNYASIAQFCQSLGFTVVLCGGPSEIDKQLEGQIQSYFDTPLPSFIGQTTLKQMASLLQKMHFVIAPDSGPAHMATAVGVPVVGLYAHSNPRRTGPYHSLPYVVNVYDDHVQAQYGKPWNKLPWGTRVKGPELMHTITIDKVQNAIRRLLGKA